MRHGDTNTQLIKTYKSGAMLFRCLNIGGVPWSYITDPRGVERFHQKTEEEQELDEWFQATGMAEEWPQ